MVPEDARTSASTEDRWTRLRAALTRAVRSQCPAWLSAHAEDLAQSALIKIMAAAEAGEGERPLSSFYLYRVAHSALVDEIRRRQRRREVSIEGVNEAGEAQPIVEPRASGDPEQGAAFNELGLAVRSCLMSMTTDRRLAVTLYLQGHSVPDAARLLGWSPKRTENLVYRGLADLRQCLLAKGHKP